MEFLFSMPTRIFFGAECIRKNGSAMKAFGKRAMIVTGKHSARACGALDDVQAVLAENGIESVLFDKVENNPSVETVDEAAQLARAEKTEFIIGIGGGSPIDAAKAIAVLAANEDRKALDLFRNDFQKVQPIVAVPTTAGTGSEATPYSVLLRKDMETKVSFGTPQTFPTMAFLDTKYTMSLSENITINTAIDAFTHSLEGYLAKRSTVMSDALALSGIEAFGKCLPHLISFTLDQEDRDNLMYASLIGGMVIAHTGVTIAHGMGYCYTYFHDIPHGKANGLLVREYLKYNAPACEQKIQKVLELLHCNTIDELGAYLELLIGKAPELTEEDVEKYTELTMIQKGSIANTPNPLDKDKIKALWNKMKENR